ncbi:hypothetical protein F2Q70_00023219 [Brassica cretica]|uniref:NAC domain-containing protein n=1 Tax=Brassica cretica TaxID=69181 RepID=A0A8S9GXU0_BRACR|nr:hypothetical protein F2Q70_00023219 [Brassica cretica]
MEKDDVPMLPVSDSSSLSRTRPFTSRSRSVSLTNTYSTIDGFDSSTVVLGYTGPLGTHRRPPLVQMSGPLSSTRSSEPLFLPPPPPTSTRDVSSSQPERYPSFAALEHKNSEEEFVLKHAHLLRSGQLGMCNDPYCTTCPSYYNRKAAQIPTSRVSAIFDSTFHDAKGWARRFATSINRHLPGIMNPHSKFVQSWTKFFAFSCLLAIFIDPLFFFLILVKQNNNCIEIDWPMAHTFVAVRSVTDVLFSVNILLQFRLAYVAPESTVVGAGQLVDHPRKIASHYFRGKFLLDLFIVMPLPQILILWIIPAHLAISGANYAKNLLRAAVLFQYIPKLYRLLPLLAGQTPTGFIFESAWANFFINLLTFMLAGHVVGSCWYLFGLQRVNQCLRDACGNSDRPCRELIDCHGETSALSAAWKDNAGASACFQEDGFPYGIYLKAVNLTNHSSLFTRYSYSLFWGFQRKICGQEIELDIIPEVDLYKCEPWDLAEKSFLPSRDPEWYFFGPRDRKYPNGFRTNRATRGGYWKSTGKDRRVTSQSRAIGMKKTLVYYRGRAPQGIRTDWVMHEYRLDDKDCDDPSSLQDSYALCRVFKKNGICSELETEPQLQTGQCSFTTVSMEMNSNNINYNSDIYEAMSPEVGASAACVEDIVDDKDDSWMQFITDDAWDSSSNAAAMGHGQGVY